MEKCDLGGEWQLETPCESPDELCSEDGEVECKENASYVVGPPTPPSATLTSEEFTDDHLYLTRVRTGPNPADVVEIQIDAPEQNISLNVGVLVAMYDELDDSPNEKLFEYSRQNFGPGTFAVRVNTCRQLEGDKNYWVALLFTAERTLWGTVVDPTGWFRSTPQDFAGFPERVGPTLVTRRKESLPVRVVLQTVFRCNPKGA